VSVGAALVSKVRLKIASVRKAVFERDRGICALCDLDAEALRRELTDLPDGERRAREKVLGWPKHRLDYWDADHILPNAEQGMPTLENLRTLCLACHREVTAEYMARRGVRNRSAQTARQVAAKPKGHALPGRDGRWWMSTGAQVIDCPQCGRETEDYPAVKCYRTDWDFQGCQARINPSWQSRGWLVWRQCEHCSWMDFREETVTLETIKAWDIGPWDHTAG
jgi:5-methylcytosine-specific restriction endonuclease McrA